MTQEFDSLDGINTVLVEVMETFQNIDYRDPLGIFLLELEQAHRFMFNQEQSPVGEQWPDIQQSTKDAKGRDDILIDMERLIDSLTRNTEDGIRRIDNSPDGWVAEFGTRVPYSRIHNEGLGIQQREHVGTTDKMVDGLIDQIADWTIAELGGDA